MHSFFSNQELQVKICGVKSAEDAIMAAQLGANALGFNFYPPSKRFVSLDTAIAILSRLPGTPLARIAVVVNPSSAEIRFILESHAFDAIQFHGDEAPEFCLKSGSQIWIKAVRIGDFDQDVKVIRSFATPYILLDSGTNAVYGGSGIPIDLSLAAQLVRALPEKRFLLAGGLRSENVREAALAVRPFAVDVASGVEHTPGRKDLSKMRAFIQATQSARANVSNLRN
ncbi:MAG: N-(5'-phosphoribosyl)anthranilate isomerase [Verrucomicrobia bacterium]|nr:MAG: N-(5'-phosphoribosyl)anthranilate isomerase [Verrucomicrobiota bacterium]